MKLKLKSKLDDLYDFSDERGYTVDELNIPASEGMTVEYDGDYYIGIDRNLSKKEKTAVLAHELGHAETGSLYYLNTPLRTKAWLDGKASAWSYRKIIPAEQIAAAFRDGDRELWQLSERFQLPEDYISNSIVYYADSPRHSERRAIKHTQSKNTHPKIKRRRTQNKRFYGHIVNNSMKILKVYL